MAEVQEQNENGDIRSGLEKEDKVPLELVDLGSAFKSYAKGYGHLLEFSRVQYCDLDSLFIFL